MYKGRKIIFNVIFCVAAATIVLFQNCGGFQAIDGLNLASIFVDAGEAKAVNVSPGVRMLSNYELQNTLNDVFLLSKNDIDVSVVVGKRGASHELLFDHMAETAMTGTLVNDYQNVAETVKNKIVDDASYYNRLLSLVCNPGRDNSRLCVDRYIERRLEIVYRREASLAEIDRMKSRYQEILSLTSGDQEAFAYLNMSMIMSPSFLYKMESGTGLAELIDVNTNESIGVKYQLDDYEIASRISYLLTGSAPDQALIRSAERGELSTDSSARKEHALRLLKTPKAEDHIYRFHAKWMGFADIPYDDKTLVTDMERETKELLKENLLVQEKDWYSILTANSSYINGKLADNYGINAGGNGFSWVNYKAETKRVGIFSHGSFLSVGKRSEDLDDTSLILRGVHFLEKVMCRELGSVPADVADQIDNEEGNFVPPPGADNCRATKRKILTFNPSRPQCFRCHQQIDSIGFGFENYNYGGKFRTTEDSTSNDPQKCKITTEGDLPGIGKFLGIKPLVDKLTSTNEMKLCLTRRALEFGFASAEFSKEDVTKVFANEMPEFRRKGSIQSLFSDLVGSEMFIHRTSYNDH